MGSACTVWCQQHLFIYTKSLDGNSPHPWSGHAKRHQVVSVPASK